MTGDRNLCCLKTLPNIVIKPPHLAPKLLHLASETLKTSVAEHGQITNMIRLSDRVLLRKEIGAWRR